MGQHIGETIKIIERTASTNNYATSQVRENDVETGTVFLAYDQTAGRGQFANRWESEAGKNLTFSLVLRPGFLEIYKQYMLSKMVCLGLERFLSAHTEGVKIKWPNDIYVHDRKICGILIENSIMSGQLSLSVIGIGLNVNQTVFLSDAPNPVSLKMLTGVDYSLETMLKELLQHMDTYYQQLMQGRFDALDEEFEQKLYRLEEWHPFQDEAHHYTGKIIGVNAIGQLRIEEKDGPVHEYHFKEVSYL
ncbi:biotin--[acetyl-CoA-carboxylase] ligase [uncultured Sunxiuqinia sp.]|uniref:biotin--[acetyl-CoA-carboxylase] ligase n=1 Tax=uncultured Sunxiuqinia sp. TaxID=1573825 RepID=UPI00262697C0|nr:biotin--[acetyl-CoA-carboxylase] ligase [uncultured Sunxiuqinia sp.]